MNIKLKLVIIIIFTMTFTGCGKLSEALEHQKATSQTTTTTVITTTTTSSTTTTVKSITSSKTTKKKTTTKNYFKAGNIKVYYGTYKQTQGFDGGKAEVVVLNSDKTCTYNTIDDKSFKCTYSYEISNYQNPDGSTQNFKSIVLKLNKKYNSYNYVTFMLGADGTLCDQWHCFERKK